MPPRARATLIREPLRRCVSLFRPLCALSLCVACLLLGACSAPGLDGPPRRPLLSGLRPLTDTTTRAPVWYHPAAPKRPTRVIAAGDELLWLAGGERWLAPRPANFGGRGADADTSLPKVAQTLAPEPLISAAKTPAGRWLFVGNSGSIYLARSPLGRFEEVRAPPQRLRRPAVSAQAALGIDVQGQLWRSADEGLSWQPSQVTTQVLGHAARVVDVGLLPSGHGLLLTLPEAVHVTHDHGRTWQQAALRPRGVLRLMPRFLRPKAGGVKPTLALGSLTSTLVFVPDSKAPSGARFVRDPSMFALPEFPKGTPRTAQAPAVVKARAAISADRYYELETSRSELSLWRGTLWSPLTKTAGELPGDCVSAALAANGDFVYVLCLLKERRMGEARVYRSVDAGESFELESYSLVVNFTELKLAVSSGGRLVASGACPARAATSGCKPRGIQVRTQRVADASDERTAVMSEAAAPFIQGNALALAAASYGDRVYAAGVRPKSEALVIFVSDDGGQTFLAKPQAQAVVASSDFNARRKLLDVQDMRVAGDGHVSLVMLQRSLRTPQLLVLNDRGDQVSFAAAPSKDHKISANGLRALAVSETSRDVWTTSDGGFSWQPRRELPPEVCPINRRGGCELEFSCADDGCLFGASLTRGWTEPELELPLPAPPDDPTPAVMSGLRPAIACEIDAEHPWQSVANNEPPDVWQTGYPDGPDWFLATAEPSSGLAKLSEGFQDSAELKQRQLFAKGDAGTTQTLGVRLQVEGIAASRQKKGGPIELAWTNYFESRAIARAKLPGPRLPSGKSSARIKPAEPALLSVARGGIYLRTDAKRNDLYFIQDNGGVETLAVPGWSAQEAQHRFEMLRVEDQHLYLRFATGAVGFLRARQTAAGVWKKDAAATGLLEPGVFGVRQGTTLSYFGGRPHLHASYQRAGEAEAWLFPFSATAAPLAAPLRVPTQAQLPAQPLACAAALMRSTPRVVAVAHPSAQHAVVVLSDTEVFAPLATSGAVLYGTVESPCVQFFATRPAGGGKAEQAYALVHPDPTKFSWVFRKKAKAEPLEVRPAHCDYEQQQAVPVEEPQHPR